MGCQAGPELSRQRRRRSLSSVPVASWWWYIVGPIGILVAVPAIFLLILWLIVKIRRGLTNATIGDPSKDHEEGHVLIGTDFSLSLDPAPTYDRTTGTISGVNANGEPVSYTKDEWCAKIREEVIRLRSAGQDQKAGAVLDNIAEIQRLLDLVC